MFRKELFLWGLRAVLGAGLTPVLDASGVEGAANDVVADTGQILHTTAADQHHGVLLKVVADTTDVWQ